MFHFKFFFQTGSFSNKYVIFLQNWFKKDDRDENLKKKTTLKKKLLTET